MLCRPAQVASSQSLIQPLRVFYTYRKLPPTRSPGSIVEQGQLVVSFRPQEMNATQATQPQLLSVSLLALVVTVGELRKMCIGLHC